MNSDELFHVGIGHEDDPPGRGSGRYEWGSGENPHQHQFTFLSEYRRLKKDGFSDSEIAAMLMGNNPKTNKPYTSTDLKIEKGIQEKSERQVNMARAVQLLDKYKGNKSAVAREMGINESSVRSLLDPLIAERTKRYENTADFLMEKVNKGNLFSNGTLIDVSDGTEVLMGVTKHTKDIAIALAERKGYNKYKIPIDQVTNKGKQTYFIVLAPPGVSYSEAYKKRLDVQPIQEFTPDHGTTWFAPKYPSSVVRDRIKVRYGDEGGADKDGTIEIRPGVKDLSLGDSNYAQVRIAVDNKSYMKGMAFYGDPKDFPDGVDIIYNSNKQSDAPDSKVFKDLKTIIDEKTGKEVIDKENPFGALIKAGGQYEYVDDDGKTKLSPINKLREEGDWNEWSKTLASQFLSKQPIGIINQQLSLSIADKKNDLDKINRLTNEVVKKQMLNDFASKCDTNAIDLSAKGFKNQAYQVLLPVPTLTDKEVYAPNYQNGDVVALIRYPHGGLFEIPVLTVNNNNKQAIDSLGKHASDAIGINPVVASQLSGADFDGDTALVIPMKSNNLALANKKPYEELIRFSEDFHDIYKIKEGSKVKPMTESYKQIQMGVTTNLITDMTIQGATDQEIIRAVKHSMVVIDAVKHNLDYRQSYKDNNIRDLVKKYQGTYDKQSGASTIISLAKNPTYINERKEVTDVWKMTDEERDRYKKGENIYRDTERTIKRRITDPALMTPEELQLHQAGKKVYRDTDELATTKIERMAIAKDATNLVRSKVNMKEMAYAEYANNLKALAMEARASARSITPYKVDKEAKKEYWQEVQSLDAKLKQSDANRPKERLAQAMANKMVQERFKTNPSMDEEHKGRERQKAIVQCRALVGAKRYEIEITDREWEAIQAKAISSTKLARILLRANQDKVKQRATPKSNGILSDAQINFAKALLASKMFTNEEIANRLGISASTVSKIKNNKL